MKLISSENDKLIYRDNSADICYVFVKYGDKFILKMIINNVSNFIVDSEFHSYCEYVMGGEYSKITIYLGKEVREIEFNNIMVITSDRIESNDITYTFNGKNYVNKNRIYVGDLTSDYYLHYFLNKRSLSNNISGEDKLIKIKK